VEAQIQLHRPIVMENPLSAKPVDDGMDARARLDLDAHRRLRWTGGGVLVAHPVVAYVRAAHGQRGDKEQCDEENARPAGRAAAGSNSFGSRQFTHRAAPRGAAPGGSAAPV